MRNISRRDFVRKIGAVTGVAVAFPSIIPASVLGENAPSKRITLGCIGMGGQGIMANLNSFLNEDDAQVLAVCDAYMGKAEKARKMVDDRYGSTGCKAYQDFRNIIEDPSIDAVVISTPETTRHWPLPPREQRNFLDCVKSRNPTTYTARDLHQMSATLHMGVIAIALGRKLKWDVKKEEFFGDIDANRMCCNPKPRKWE